jgi:hypothetical protein
MPSNLSIHSPLRPLSVGNVVTAGVIIYRSHLKLYLKMALRANLWALLPVLVLVPILIAIVNNGSASAILWLILPVWFILLLYCTAKHLANSASISRLAFNDLIARPENAKSVEQDVNRQMWNFLLTAILIWLILFGVFVVVYFALALAIFLPLIIFTSSILRQPNFMAAIVVSLLGLAIVLILLIVLSWIYSRLIIAEVPLAIESKMAGTTAISRSWQLTKGSAWRIQLILLIITLIILPLWSISELSSELLEKIMIPQIFRDIALVKLFSPLIAYTLALGFNIFILPLWQSVKAVIYFDLRSRREGLGLQLRQSLIEDSW